MKNILLLVSYFPPDNHVGAWRWARLTKKLEDKGYKIHVVSIDNKNKDYGIEKIKGVHEVQRIKNPYRRSIRHLYSRYKSSFSYTRKTEVSGNNLNKPPSKRKYEELTNLGKIRRFISLLIDFPDFSWSSSIYYFKEGSRIIENNHIDIIIGSHPYVSCIKAANELSLRYKIPWIADLRDGWSGNLFTPYSDFRLLFSLLKRKEEKLLRGSSKVVTINSKLAKVINCDESKIEIISNSFEGVMDKPEEDLAYKKDTRSKKNFLEIFFSGGVKSDHNFYPLLRAIKKFRDMKGDHIRFHYYGKRFDFLDSYGKSIKLDPDTLIDHGYVNISEVNQAINEMHVLIIFGWLGKHNDTYQTGKVFDYINSFKPIIAIDNDTSALAETINICRAGFVSTKEDEIFKYLIEAYENNNFHNDFISKLNIDAINSFSVENTSNQYDLILKKLIKL